MKKRSRKKQKNKGLFLVAIAVLVVGIGFAALQKYLTIDGTASINSNFDVRFSWIDTADIVGGAYNKSEPSVTGTTATFDAAFLAPGDSISYDIYIENLGTMNAKLENIDVNIENTENIGYEITGINSGDILEAVAYSEGGKGDGGSLTDPTRKTINLKLTYKGDGSEAITSNVKVTMKFVQTNEQTENQTDAISLIENEKPKVSYQLVGVSDKTNDHGEIPYEIYVDWNSENIEQLTTYILGVEVYQKYSGDIWQIEKNATDELLLIKSSNFLKIRNVYVINGVKYYSQYSDEFNLHFINNDGFISDSKDLTTIIATDDSYFTDGVMTLPVGKKFNKLTSNNVTKVILEEDYNLSDLGKNSLSTKKYYPTSLDTIVNKTGESIDWAPIVGWFAYDYESGSSIKCEFVTGTCAGVNIVAE